MKLRGLSNEAVERIARKTGMAFLAEPDLPSGEQFGGVHEYPGFHTTENFDVAAAYAAMRVANSFTEEAEDGTHYVTDYPVVVALDMAGHLPQTDYDAEKVVKDRLYDELKEMIDHSNLTPESSDEEILEALEYAEMGGQEYETESMEDWGSQLWQHVQYTMRNPVSGLYGQDADLAVHATRTFMEMGEIPEDALIVATDQYRYEEDISELRLRGVWYIQPHATEMSDWQGEDNPYFEGLSREQLELRWPGFEVTDVDDFYGGTYGFQSEQVWEDEEPRYEEDLPGQLPLFTQEQLPREPVIQYHGTTLSRLLQASPELAGQLPAPPSPPYQGELAMAARRTANESLEGEIDLPGGYASISWQDGVLYLFNFEADEPGHGSGSQMWEALKEMIPSGTTVELDSFLSAVDFWEKMGFEQIGPIDDGYQPMRMVAMAAKRVAQYEPYQPPGVDMEGLPQIWLEEIVGGIYRVRVDTESDRFGHINREGRKWEATIRRSDGELIHYAGIWDSLRAAIHEVAFYLDRDAFLEMPDEWYYP